jgi:8-oxo-dGTP pyrophosphatase MutT (NUDIX family)
MTILEIQEKLKHPLPGMEAQKKMSPKFREVIMPENTKHFKESAVLLSLIPKNGSLYIPLIKRTKSKGSHSGQISFPGGKFEKSDTDFEFTAKREAHEEIGLKLSEIEIIGILSPLYIPISQFIVYPFVAFYPSTNDFNLNKREVEELLMVDLKDFFNPEVVKTEMYTILNQEHEIPYFDVVENKVWGATAMIIKEFIEAIS